LLVAQTLRGKRIWNFPGGKLEFGESGEGAAQRETFEETGLRVLRMRLLLDRILVIDGVAWLGRYYAAECVEGTLRIHQADVSALAFKSRAKLVALPQLGAALADVSRFNVVSASPATLRRLAPGVEVELNAADHG